MIDVYIVLVGETAVEDVESHDLTQAQAVDEGYAVENPAFEVVGGEERHIAVHDELHGLHGIERIVRHPDA